MGADGLKRPPCLPQPYDLLIPLLVADVPGLCGLGGQGQRQGWDFLAPLRWCAGHCGIIEWRGEFLLLGHDPLQFPRMLLKDVEERLREILEQVKAIGDLHRLGGPRTSALGVRLKPIPADDCHPGMGLQPARQGSRLAIREQSQGLPPLDINQHRAIRVPFPLRPVIDPEHAGDGELRLRPTT
jgi:hypothetical protein